MSRPNMSTVANRFGLSFFNVLPSWCILHSPESVRIELRAAQNVRWSCSSNRVGGGVAGRLPRVPRLLSCELTAGYQCTATACVGSCSWGGSRSRRRSSKTYARTSSSRRSTALTSALSDPLAGERPLSSRLDRLPDHQKCSETSENRVKRSNVDRHSPSGTT